MTYTADTKINVWAPTAEERAAAPRPHPYHANRDEWCEITGRDAAVFRKACRRIAADMPGGPRVANLTIASEIVLDEARFQEEEAMLAALDRDLREAGRRATLG